jgi:glucosamine--fructose-6-phosphate aminotransferase (isomerizing)
LEFGRYVAQFVPSESIVIGISNSGKTSRPVEALVNSRLVGARTIAITGNRQGRLAEESDIVLDQSAWVEGENISMPSVLSDHKADEAPIRGYFGLVNYLASLTTLYMVAIHAGEVRGRLDQIKAGELRAELRGMANAVDEAIRLSAPSVQDYARDAKNISNFTILGTGPNYGTSLFYAAKMFELSRLNGVPQLLEEWAHEQFFIMGPGSQILFIVPPGRGATRAVELMETVKVMEGISVVVTDEMNTELRAHADVVLPMPGNIREVFSPLAYCVPGALLATYLAQARGRQSLGFDSRLQYEMNMRAIQESQIVAFSPTEREASV